MDTLEILKAGRELISDPARWTQHTAARDEGGDWVSERSESAVCWCSIGALWKVADWASEECSTAMSALEPDGPDSLLAFNDTHTHAEVLAMWDRAIAAESAKAAP